MNIQEGKGQDILANKDPDQHKLLYRVDQGNSLPIYGPLYVSLDARESVLWVLNKVRLKPVCSTTETS